MRRVLRALRIWRRPAPLLPEAPVSRAFGLDRGTAVDRVFIEKFLADNAQHVQGNVLEIGDDAYTRRFGSSRVGRAAVLHRTGNARADYVDDLAVGATLPSDAFDCVILTQTLQFIQDPAAAVATVRRILRPDGIVLATVPGITQISRYDADRWGDYWRWTSSGLRLLFAGGFSEVEVKAFGNVRTACAQLYGVSAEELLPSDFGPDGQDADYEVVVCLRARKPA